MDTNDEYQRSINGIEGRMFRRTPRDVARGTWLNQTWKTSREFHEGSQRRVIVVEMRFDDCCGNGHNDFAITAEIRDPSRRGDRGYLAGGCLHDEIAQHFPGLAPLIKWHLCGTDGPMHYIANAVYFAGNRDCHGLREGESRQIRNGKTGAPVWRLVATTADGRELREIPKYVDSETQPEAPAVRVAYEPWLKIGEGKAREFDKARSSAVWPEATDEELSAEPEALRAALTARLPALLAAFRRDMVEVCGFAWST